MSVNTFDLSIFCHRAREFVSQGHNGAGRESA
jgi:hypothetical protein